MSNPTKHKTLADAIAYLRAEGHEVTEENIPGLYRINGSPEITEGHILQLSNQITGDFKPGDPWIVGDPLGAWDMRW